MTTSDKVATAAGWVVAACVWYVIFRIAGGGI
jgi:hypothetical protein